MISVGNFIDYCNTLIDKQLETLWLHKKFRLISSNNEELRWIVESTDRERWSKKRYISKYLTRYEETKSLHPKDYKKYKTTEASYILALINLYNKNINKS